MKMTINYQCENVIIFNSISITDCYYYVLALVIIFLLSIAYEYLLYYRCTKVCDWTINQNKLLANSEDNSSTSKKNIEISLNTRLLLTIMYTSIVICSYILMFILMTYNLGLILVIIFGNTLGYLLFFNDKHEVIKDITVY